MKVALLIAPQDFRDEEYFITKNVLEEAGITVDTFSSQRGEAVGSYGGVVEVENMLSDLRVNQFDGLVFVGGSGALKYLNTEEACLLARQAVSYNKLLGAICIAPVILAQSGVLKGKKATVWQSPLDKSAVKILKSKGALFEPKTVVRDGKVITANGPGAARQFGQIIARALLDIKK